jgi:flagellum-specific peptidoglycan hydrolase FlgJ
MQPNADVIAAAQAAQSKWGIPTSFDIAQFALESGWGAHMPGNNPFGIKAMTGYDTQTFATHEVVNGHLIPCSQTFAKFKDLAQAFECHAKLIATALVYSSAMKALPNLERFVALLAPHYATDPQYGAKIMAVIKGSNLTQYDK